MAKFELVTRFAGEEALLPKRGSAASAGYDLFVAEDIIIPPAADLIRKLELMTFAKFYSTREYHPGFQTLIEAMDENPPLDEPLTLDEIANFTKKFKAKPTLVSSGIKCKLDPDTYLELSVRSSTPLKHWLIMANSVGVIDADYYNNPDNEGEIFFQMINLSPFPISLKKGDRICQGIIKPYLTTEDDAANGARLGGFGSTS